MTYKGLSMQSTYTYTWMEKGDVKDMYMIRKKGLAKDLKRV